MGSSCSSSLAAFSSCPAVSCFLDSSFDGLRRLLHLILGQLYKDGPSEKKPLPLHLPIHFLSAHIPSGSQILQYCCFPLLSLHTITIKIPARAASMIKIFHFIFSFQSILPIYVIFLKVRTPARRRFSSSSSKKKAVRESSIIMRPPQTARRFISSSRKTYIPSWYHICLLLLKPSFQSCPDCRHQDNTVFPCRNRCVSRKYNRPSPFHCR